MFRQDLYYRINVVRIELPPLRMRGDDIGLLAEFFANRHSREMSRPVPSITTEAYQVLRQYPWPGNVRELQNVIRRAIALSTDKSIDVDDLPDEVIAASGQRESTGDAGYFQLRDQHIARFELAIPLATCSNATTATSAPPPAKQNSPAARSIDC